MIDALSLLADVRKTVNELVEDIRSVATSEPDAVIYVAAEYERAHTAGRTAFGQTEWAEGLYAQVAVAWTLGCVFVRFCEDNDLIAEPLLGGPGLRTQLALDQRAAYLQANPADDDRHWLREVFSRLRRLPATGEIFGGHNPVWLGALAPSADGARRLREDLTRIDPDTGQVRHDFGDPTWDSRFLGDLYQDLSDHAKKTYALLQTPIFVEEFILDRTLEPAIDTFGLADTTLIDPTCGSGHFLLGAFDRLFRRWLDADPGVNRRVLAQRALDALGGVDLNPFAVSIARFRLLLAGLRAGGDVRLADAPAYDLNVVVGDSLLHGDPPGALPGMHIPGEEEGLLADHGYSSEDHASTRDLLRRTWSAVVGNPPYIVVKDPALNAAYRQRFKTCHRQYSLGVPFTQRFWQLARSDSDSSRSGFVGMITTNSFMKREFGKKLIEQWVPDHDLTHVIDTAGAYIPGHGTPTVILFGRNRRPVAHTVRTVMGIRGEPSKPTDPEKGLVWSSVVQLLDSPGSQSDYVSVVDLDRARLARHPWSIGGGGAAELKEFLDGERRTLGDLTSDLGRTTHTGEDEAYVLPRHASRRMGGSAIELVIGEDVRDYRVTPGSWALFPYDDAGNLRSVAAAEAGPVERHYWMLRVQLRKRLNFGQTNEERGLAWWEYSMFFKERFLRPLSITFASVATHNHFVLDRGGKVFKQSAPVIKLPADASEERHLDLLGVLNSSTACFWIKQVMHYKGAGGNGESVEAYTFQQSWDIDGTKLKQFPIASEYPLVAARALDRLAQQLAETTPAAIADADLPTPQAFADAEFTYSSVRSEMISAQERLDWECYGLYGLADMDVVAGPDPEPPLHFGERAFEILLARRVAAGVEGSSWFDRHGSRPITELPKHWTPQYQALVERRIDIIDSDLNIGLIERPDYKRRWVVKSWDEQVADALKSWLLDRLESPRHWPIPAAITTVARLTSEVRSDTDFVQVSRMYAGRDDVDLAALVGELLRGQSVSYVAACRYTDSGLRKHAEWIRTWSLQRDADAGEDVGEIPAPPKFAKPDFTGMGWDHRGKFDVPKERFIAYPGAERETDVSAVFGWAGWDHLERARALAAWYLLAKRDGRDGRHLVPMLAGLSELVPWLKQWYDAPNADPSLDRPGSQVASLVVTEMRSLGLTPHDLVSWRPPSPAGRGRPRKASA